MRVQTLVYIKEMLEKEVETREKVVKKLRERLVEAEDESGVQWNTPDSKKTFAEVPEVIKEKVKQILIDLEVPELAE